MKNKLVFRILGALASALIIASVFIPFVSVTGYSQSLWQAHESVGTLYLPLMIIAFGTIGVLVFSTNFKTELAYASAGGLLFFLIMQTIPIIDQGTFSTLSVGYYCLVIGTLLIIVMAFLCGLRAKQKVVENQPIEDNKAVSVIDQIDKLYNDQALSNNNLDNVIQPIPVGTSLNSDSILVESQIPTPVVSENNSEPVVVAGQPTSAPVENLNNQSSEQINAISQPLNNNMEVGNSNNNALQSNIPVQPTNLAVSNFNVPTQNIVDQPNPVVAEFSQPQVSQPQVQSNPVVAEFSQGVPQVPVQQPTMVPETTTIEPIQPMSSEKKVDVMAEPTNNSSNLDIFG